jgi:uncharacterized protein
LTEQIVKTLEGLNIKGIQVTIDGMQDEHNKTRIHKTNADSFSIIVNNIDKFFQRYNKLGSISLNIRVNLAKNSDYVKKFLEVYIYFRKKYQYENLFISPGFIEDIKANGYQDNEFDRTSIKDFYQTLMGMGLYDFSLYPENRNYECAIRSEYDFVIGPKGELYSCWENIGYQENVVGYLSEKGDIIVTNELYYYRYMVDNDYLHNAECRDCFFFPVCSGGCPEKRLRNKHNNACFDVCVLQKGFMNEILDLHYEIKNKLQWIQKQTETETETETK